MKLTEEIKVALDEATAEAFRRRALRAGCRPGELLRDLICMAEYGRTWGEHVADVRRDVLSSPRQTSPQQAATAAAVVGHGEVPQVFRRA